MKRFLLLLLIIALIVVGLAWATGHSAQQQVIPVPAGSGGIAWTGHVTYSLFSASNAALQAAA